MDRNYVVPRGEEEITWRDLRRIAWHRRYVICGVTIACMVLAAAAAWLSPKEYVASILVAPVAGETEGHLGSVSSMVSRLGSLASLAGIASPTDTKQAETLAILKSAKLTEGYIEQNHLLQVLYAKEWDARSGKWLVTDPAKVPTLWKADRFFAKKIRAVAVDPKNGLVTLTIRWTNPQQAAQWANGLVDMTNEYTRQQAIEQAQRNIAYLTAQAAKTDVVGVREEIYALLQSQIDRMMLARGTDEYALKVLDPAQIPELPSSPMPVVWTLAGLVGGVLVGLLIAFGLGEPERYEARTARTERLKSGVSP